MPPRTSLTPPEWKLLPQSLIGRTSNTNVITVNSAGLITAGGSGSATVSATLNGRHWHKRFCHRSNECAHYYNRASKLFEPFGVWNPQCHRWSGRQHAAHLLLVLQRRRAAYQRLQFDEPGHTNVTLSSAGSYTCLVSNQFGTTNSTPLVLAVTAPDYLSTSIVGPWPLAYWPLDENQRHHRLRRGWLLQWSLYRGE